MRELGLVPHPDGTCSARVWAPNAGSVAVVTDAEQRFELDPETDGFFATDGLPLAAGDDYRFELDNGDRWPDPCSRLQPDGVSGPSRVVDTTALRPPPWSGIGLDDLVVYELHVGTFTAEGTFDAAIERLPALRELGVTAIELMPVATFPGERGWGYDGLYTSAPHPAYGGPPGLARLVAAAHEHGLGVLLDVVYNHVGPGNEALRAFGPYFLRRDTEWGDAMDFSQRGVREWAIGNAELWIRDYGVDGLRLDAVHAIHDRSTPHVLRELADRVRAANPRALVISEMGAPDFRPLEEWGHDAMWLDNLHHALHVALTGERDGYYGDFDGSMAGIARELERPLGPRIVACAQNHDQVGNRAVGDRLPPSKLRVAQSVVLLAPYTPLLFQGEEVAEPRPFQFFSDHVDPLIADATRDGRRREFAGFAGFAGEVPDPQAPETFERSRLAPEDGDPEHRAFVARLLRLRRQLADDELEVLRADEDERVLELRRGPVTLRADFAAETVELR
jgi:maltooligosyltrehalose trehalohydrolase